MNSRREIKREEKLLVYMYNTTMPTESDIVLSIGTCTL